MTGNATQQTTGKMQGGVANLTNAGKGRKKGVPNKVTGQLKDMILQALNEADPRGAVEYLKGQATENPTAFLTLVGKVLPLQIAGDKDNPVHTVSEHRIDMASLSEAALREIAALNANSG